MDWGGLEVVAPEIFRLGTARLEQAGVALLGTLRKDGTPRISPVEPFFAGGELIFGTMSWAAKTRDLRRDPRCVLHSAVSGPDAMEGELKLHGRVSEVRDEIRDTCAGAWWLEHPREAAVVFALEIEQAAFISWEAKGAEMTVRRWSSRRGYRETVRKYP